MSQGPHTDLALRIEGWRAIEREQLGNVRLARVLYLLVPTQRRRAMLVKALSGLETARAALDVLQPPALVTSARSAQ